ncbi:hypothetical protein VNO77_25236 [Canavalia gladiata]|uniref:Uncharacterized protein n=1 Tax=Canavalia gladiata TaxID=3824 RepID=A0AAN9LA93_CANGL
MRLKLTACIHDLKLDLPVMLYIPMGCLSISSLLVAHSSLSMTVGGSSFFALQVVLDEMEELESSTKQIVASYRQCSNEAHRETRLVLEDLRMQRLKFNV